MAAVVEVVVARVVSTDDQESYLTAAFTPSQGDLLVVFTAGNNTVAVPGLLASANGITFTRALGIAADGGNDRDDLWVADQLVGASPSAMTLGLTFTGDAAAGAYVIICRVTGMAKVGAAAVKQVAGSDNNLGGGATPSVTFAASITAGNPVAAFVTNNTNPATLTEPSGFSEDVDTGYATPTSGCQMVHVNSHAGGSSTLTWGNTSTRGGIIAIELDASGGGPDPNSGSATGTHAWAGTANGARSPEGSATGTHQWAGTADGARASAGTSTGTHSWAGTATGATPPVGAHTGSATGTHQWAGVAVGTAQYDVDVTFTVGTSRLAFTVDAERIVDLVGSDRLVDLVDTSRVVAVVATSSRVVTLTGTSRVVALVGSSRIDREA